MGAMKRVQKRNFHLPLPCDLYRELQAEAQQAGQPATVVARQAIEFWVRQNRKAERHRAIAAYASKWAASKLDLDPEMERAAVEHLVKKEGRRS